MKKFFHIVIFILGLFMLCNFFFLFEETEEIEGIVEDTYVGSYYNGVAKRSSKGTPMCSVVWYDKDGEKVTYGMPNDRGYEVGDSYYLEVDTDTNRIPKRSPGECIVAGIIGLLTCTICVASWIMGVRPKKKEKTAILTPIERKRKEVYNEQDYFPIMKCSICNGEQVAGFKDKKTGQFTEVMLIKNEGDLEVFKHRYGVKEVKKEY